MTEKQQKDLIDRVESLEKDIKKKPYRVELLVVFGYMLLLLIAIYLADNKQNKIDEDLYSKNEELRKIICDIHKDTNTPAGYKYDPNLVKKLQEWCKSNTH